MKIFKLLPLILLLIFMMGTHSANGQNSGSDSPKLILIHLDAVSASVLRTEIDAGNMPNIKRIFNEEGLLETAITYYPSKTPFIISNIRSGTPSDTGELVGWDIPDFDYEKDFSIEDSFLKMALSKQRISRANLLQGLPFFSGLKDLALMNTLDLFDEYPVQEFYWYKADSYGHFEGEEEYLRKVRQFDERIGKYIDKLDDDINIIIYSDHGMVFGEGVELDKQISERFSEEIKIYSYPTMYLKEGTDAETMAKKVIEETDLDFAFFLQDRMTAKGFFENSTLYFEYQDGKIRYRHDGPDPFDYFDNGYNGEFLTADEWLSLTINLDYPATPVKVFAFLQNPNAGEIVTSLDNTKFNKTGYSQMGNHGGFTATDVVVPVMVRGPDVGYIGEFDKLWLQELFNELDQFTFKQEPKRDTHYISSRYDFSTNTNRTVTAFSPTYRFRLGADIDFGDFNGADLNQVWGKYDIFRSQLARVWIGGGVDFSRTDTVGMFMIRHEFRIRNFSAKTSLTTNRNNQFTLAYDIHDNFSLELTNFSAVGFRLSL